VKERIGRALLQLFKDHADAYLDIFAVGRDPKLTLTHFQFIKYGEWKSIPYYPALTITPAGSSKISDDISYAEVNNDILDSYRYQVTMFIEGDDPEQIEFYMDRYIEAMKAMLHDYYNLGGIVRGLIVSSVDDYNLVGGGMKFEKGSRLNIDVIADHLPVDVHYTYNY
jgi:hypothetical protein